MRLPPPGPDACDYLGGVGPGKLASVWHRLRPELADDAEVLWFCRAKHLRLLGTHDHVVAYHPDGLKGNHGLRFRIKYSAISTVDATTRAASLRLHCAGDHGRCTHDLDLDGSIAEAVIMRLRASTALQPAQP